MRSKKQGASAKTSRAKSTGPRSKTDRIARTAREKFGYTSLRPGQGEAAEALLSGHDCLVVMPTGSGKSAIYQIAGSMMKGAVLVISPLIALQKDQVDSINETRAEDAVVLNSTQTVSDTRESF